MKTMVNIKRLADVVGTISPGNTFVKPGPNTVQDKIQTFINAFINIVIIVAVVGIIYNGLNFILAGGDSTKVEKATKGIIYSAIGIIIAFVAGIVVQFLIKLIKG